MQTILLIEKNSYILDNLTEYLEMENYTILASNNGKRGLQIAQEQIPNLIICDVWTHEMDGHQVLPSLLNTNKTIGIPFIFSTSMPDKINRASALKLGADDYIIKPFEIEILLNMAKTWIASGSKRCRNALPIKVAI